MATLTVRNLPPKLVASLKRLARENQRSMEQEVRRILEDQVPDRLAAVESIRESWTRQRRATTSTEIERWVRVGRP